jgi:hypothetical protein
LLIASFAIITHLLASAISRSNESERLENATIVVENVAEEFSADPTSVPERRIVDDFLITCTVEADSTEAGTLYTADIVASDEEGTAYELKTARYVSGVSS